MQVWEWYVNIAPDIRMVCYAIVGVVTMLQAGHYWSKHAPTVSLIHMITGLFMLTSFHFAWTRNPDIALYATTPLVAAWAITCLNYTRKWFL